MCMRELKFSKLQVAYAKEKEIYFNVINNQYIAKVFFLLDKS